MPRRQFFALFDLVPQVPVAAVDAAAAAAAVDAVPDGEEVERDEAVDELYTVADTNLFMAFCGWINTETADRTLDAIIAAVSLQPAEDNQLETCLATAVQTFFQDASDTVHRHGFSQSEKNR